MKEKFFGVEVIRKKRPLLICICFLTTLLLTNCNMPGERTSENSTSPVASREFKIKPFRVLIVINDQWKDPMSYHIDPTHVEGTDFLDVVNMLKIWGVPFDILRLDEQRLQINRFLSLTMVVSSGWQILISLMVIQHTIRP